MENWRASDTVLMQFSNLTLRSCLPLKQLLLPTNDQQAEENGHPAGLLLFLGLDPRLLRQDGLVFRRLRGRGLGHSCGALNSVIAGAFCVVCGPGS